MRRAFADRGGDQGQDLDGYPEQLILRGIDVASARIGGLDNRLTASEKVAILDAQADFLRGFVQAAPDLSEAQVAQRFGVMPHIRFGRRVLSAAFDEADGRWRIDGNKIWITHGARSDLMTLLARTVREKPSWEAHPENMLELVAYAWLNAPPEKVQALEAALAPGTVEQTLKARLARLGSSLDPMTVAIESNDALGLTHGKRPRFVRDFTREPGSAADAPGLSVAQALRRYVVDVKAGRFPDEAVHGY